MSNGAKRNLWGGALLLCAVVMAFCLWRMIPYGLAGEAGKVKSYFFVAMVAFVGGLVSGMAYRYHLSDKDTELERMRAEVEILAQAGQKPPANVPKQVPPVQGRTGNGADHNSL